MDNRSRTLQLQKHARTLASFARHVLRITLRPYQLQAAQAVIDSIRQGAGRSIVILFSRQSGKDELSANLKAYLLARRHTHETGIVEVNPTYKPQTINAIQRLEDRLRNPLTGRRWRKRSDFMRLVGRAKVSFLSGDSKANVVGAVASLLLIVNEAQDIEPAVYDRNFAPMAASTNATRLFMGTAWTSRTLLARELRSARQAEQQDGIRRVFMYDADDVRKVLPAYGVYVDGEIARLGRGHPLIRTQYFNEEIDAQAGMFNPARRALMRCGPPPAPAGPPPPNRREQPGEGRPLHADLAQGWSEGRWGPLVFALDIAGQDESTFHNPDEQVLRNPGRDSISLTIAAVDLSTLDTLQAPIFRILRREQWTGLNHLAVFGKLCALADLWNPQHIIVDATGVGEGLWAMLDKRYPTRLIPVKFSAPKKSEIGYRFIAMIETGRLRDCTQYGLQPPLGIPAPRGAGIRGDASATRLMGDKLSPRESGEPSSTVKASDVDKQYSACVSEVLTGPQHTLRWGVPEGTRDEDGVLIHDDLLMADSLLAEADMLDWTIRSETRLIPGRDPLEEMSRFS